MGKGDKHKRIRISIKLKDPRSILEERLLGKLGCFYYLCCGVTSLGTNLPQRFCACCCICVSSDDIVSMVADKVSLGLAEAGILNEVQFFDDGSNEFFIIVRKMNTAKQVMAKSILHKKITQKLEASNIEATVEVTRDRASVFKTTDELIETQTLAKKKREEKNRKLAAAAAKQQAGIVVHVDGVDASDAMDGMDAMDAASGDEIYEPELSAIETSRSGAASASPSMRSKNSNRTPMLRSLGSKSRSARSSKSVGLLDAADSIGATARESVTSTTNGNGRKISQKQHLRLSKLKDMDSDEDDFGTDLSDIENVDFSVNESAKFTMFARKKKQSKLSSNVGTDYQQLDDISTEG